VWMMAAGLTLLGALALVRVPPHRPESEVSEEMPKHAGVSAISPVT
jgi:hypothetical protein